MNQLVDTQLNVTPTDHQVQQLISAEKGYPASGIPRAWLRPDDDVPILIVDEDGLRVSRDDGTSAPAPPIVVGSPAGGDLDGTYPDPTVSAGTLDSLIPPGTIWAYGGATAPAGWLLCDGAEVSRTTYAKLFAVVGTAYGSAGATTFTLPDFRGRVVMGVSGTHARGTIGGSETTPGPPHTHPGTHSHGQNSHTHGTAHTHPGSHSHGVSHDHPGSHSHGQNGHSHTSDPHEHSLNGHSHTVDVSHDHLSAHPTGTSIVVSPAVPPSVTLVNGVAPLTLLVATDQHYHQFDVPAKSADTESLGPSTTNTGTVTPDPTGGPSPTTTNTDATAHAASISTTVTDSTAPAASPAVSAVPSPTTTETDATAHGASYPGVVSVMQPWGTANWMIRVGAA